MTNNEPIGQPIRSLQIMLRAIAQNDADVLPEMCIRDRNRL